MNQCIHEQRKGFSEAQMQEAGSQMHPGHTNLLLRNLNPKVESCMHLANVLQTLDITCFVTTRGRRVFLWCQ